MQAESTEQIENPVVDITTTLGVITAELWPDKAPVTVENFLKYAADGFFDGTIFHRVIDGFMIQGGGFTPDMQRKETRAPIVNEARADVPNLRGTLAMARTPHIHSATAQFFINQQDNPSLNHRSDMPMEFGYCVFGKVTDGMDVVDRIAKARTVAHGMMRDIPAEAVVIQHVRVRSGDLSGVHEAQP